MLSKVLLATSVHSVDMILKVKIVTETLGFSKRTAIAVVYT